MVYVPFILPFSPFVSLPNPLDAERSHTYIVLGSAMRCLYFIMLLVLVFSMALIYLLVAVSDKLYTLLWLGVFIVLIRSLRVIAFTASALNCSGYLCVVGWIFQRSVWIGGLISSCTSSTLVASTELRVSTLSGGFITLGSSVVLGLADVGSTVIFVVSSNSIVDSSLSAVKVLLLKVA